MICDSCILSFVAGVDPDVATRTDRGDWTTGDNVGTNQSDELKSHTHETHMLTLGYGLVTGSGDDVYWGNTKATGGSETSPKNIYVLYYIKS